MRGRGRDLLDLQDLDQLGLTGIRSGARIRETADPLTVAVEDPQGVHATLVRLDLHREGGRNGEVGHRLGWALLPALSHLCASQDGLQGQIAALTGLGLHIRNLLSVEQRLQASLMIDICELARRTIVGLVEVAGLQVRARQLLLQVDGPGRRRRGGRTGGPRAGT